MVDLHIRDETSPLTDLCVCRGTAIPDFADFDGYRDAPDESARFPPKRWDRDRFLAQQEQLYEVFDRHGVRLHFVDHDDDLVWQAYTRDTGFVVGDRLFYAPERGLPERHGEIDVVMGSIPGLDGRTVELERGRIEGGDVMPDDDLVFVGLGTRTDRAAAEELAEHVDAEVVTLDLRSAVMHLDTRMTVLPGRRALIHPPAFRTDDLALLRRRFTFVEVDADEAAGLGTNGFVIDPETILVHTGHERIARAIEAEGLRVERVDYADPIALLGSFRCTTMPLARR
ncbi:MAG: arginine deiminase family protein [Actinomycetota bacterium]